MRALLKAVKTSELDPNAGKARYVISSDAMIFAKGILVVLISLCSKTTQLFYLTSLFRALTLTSQPSTYPLMIRHVGQAFCRRTRCAPVSRATKKPMNPCWALSYLPLTLEVPET